MIPAAAGVMVPAVVVPVVGVTDSTDVGTIAAQLGVGGVLVVGAGRMLLWFEKRRDAEREIVRIDAAALRAEHSAEIAAILERHTNEIAAIEARHERELAAQERKHATAVAALIHQNEVEARRFEQTNEQLIEALKSAGRRATDHPRADDN